MDIPHLCVYLKNCATIENLNFSIEYIVIKLFVITINSFIIHNIFTNVYAHNPALISFVEWLVCNRQVNPRLSKR